MDSLSPRPGYRKPVGYNPPPRGKKPRFRLWLALAMLIFLAVGIFIGSKLVIFAERILDGSNVFSFGKLLNFGGTELIGEEEGEVRVLLLGIGGGQHDGSTLTDTVILATIKPAASRHEEPRVSLFSIPRDFLINLPGYDYQRLNTAYAFGEAVEEGRGPATAVRAVERIIGKEIPYYIVLDFEGFRKIVDDLGGLVINVETGFVDARFPDKKGGYLEPLRFEQGLQRMDGRRALQYVRSRHGNNNQGSDFARARRQHQILRALKEQAVNLKVITNLSLVSRLMDDLSNHLRTNLEPAEIKRLYDIGSELKTSSILSLSLDTEIGLICDHIVEETGAYVLVPCEGLENYSRIRNLVDNQFFVGSIRAENAKIEIQNASSVEGLGASINSRLGLAAYIPVTITNFRQSAQYQETIIYDNTGGQKPETLKHIRDRLGAQAAQSPFPFPTASANPDFVIVVVNESN